MLKYRQERGLMRRLRYLTDTYELLWTSTSMEQTDRQTDNSRTHGIVKLASGIVMTPHILFHVPSSRLPLARLVLVHADTSTAWLK